MRNYDYRQKWQKLLTPEIVGLLTCLHEFKGEQIILPGIKPEFLTALTDEAKVRSAEAFGKTAELGISEERLKKLVLDKMTPKTRSEREIAGYRDALVMIQENCEYLPLKPTIILQLHDELYKFVGQSVGGSYKNADNITVEGEESKKTTQLPHVSAAETPSAMEALCSAFAEAEDEKTADALLLIPMFMLDFLCVRPFDGGNGRMSRLLLLLLLQRAGYMAGKYVSIEKRIKDSEDSCFEALKSSSVGWDTGESEYAPFVRQILGSGAEAYKELRDRIRTWNDENLPKSERIGKLIRGTDGAITKAEIMQKNPDISQITVQRTLNDLLKNNEIKKIGGGRYTSYVWNHTNRAEEKDK